MSRKAKILHLFLFCYLACCFSFSPQIYVSRKQKWCPAPSDYGRPFDFRHPSRSYSVSLAASPIGRPLQGVLLLLENSGPVRLSALFVAAIASMLLYRNRMKLLWPGAKADSSFSEPLPPGSFGCPLIGLNLLKGSKRKGPEFLYRQLSKRTGEKRILKTYFMGRPLVLVSGSSLVQNVNNMEFSSLDSRSTGAVKRMEKEGYEEGQVVFGKNNLMFERNKDRHGFLRRLVGAAMTPQALKEALPTIQKTAEEVIHRELLQCSKDNTTMKMENVAEDYTMGIVQNQLLGLQLGAEEVHIFRNKLKEWLKAMYSLVSLLNIPWLVKRSASYKAKQYIVSKLEDRVDSLLKNGPDTSTLSNMLFAVDEDNGSTKLSREQVIENAQLLVIAGSETSAGTLTLAMLLLGLHPDKYNKLVEEQAQLIRNHGAQLTETILDKECPYLDAVVKETLRMGPVTSGFPRTAKETIVIDGVQIPQDWAVATQYRLTHQLDPVTRLPNDAHMDPYTGFQPERWSNPETTPSDWIPFGAGPRFCLGYHLAMMEMKVFLAMFARRVASFDLANCDRVVHQAVRWNPGTMIPRPSDGVLVDSWIKKIGNQK